MVESNQKGYKLEVKNGMIRCASVYLVYDLVVPESLQDGCNAKGCDAEMKYEIRNDILLRTFKDYLLVKQTCEYKPQDK
eukprot:1382098-Karenia_brevis.AAC.1